MFIRHDIQSFEKQYLVAISFLNRADLREVYMLVEETELADDDELALQATTPYASMYAADADKRQLQSYVRTVKCF